LEAVEDGLAVFHFNKQMNNNYSITPRIQNELRNEDRKYRERMIQIEFGIIEIQQRRKNQNQNIITAFLYFGFLGFLLFLVIVQLKKQSKSIIKRNNTSTPFINWNSNFSNESLWNFE